MITVVKHSGIYTLRSDQKLPITIERAWNFFSDPGNLAKITPPPMGFEITSPEVKSMHEGQIISYRVGILPFIKSNWITEITHVKEREYFVDEQRKGPYRMWHHEHIFRKIKKGVEMVDRVTYAVPYGKAGEILNSLLIEKQLLAIFSYRYNYLNNIFGTYPA